MFLLLHWGWRPTGKDATPGHYFHSDDSHLFLEGQWKKILFKAVIVLVRSVDAHQNGVKGKSVDAFHECFGAKTAGNSKMPHHFLIACLNQGFYGAVFPKYLVNIFLNPNIVELPGI